ncbi:hypothetical protein LX36DRAFT_248481 [Colletotrichum falcatum]|nr:hypothetical protein LX36DRAFT_248481 [Colletotrichum falcatum]
MDAQLCHLRETWNNIGDAKFYGEALWVLRKCDIFILQQLNGLSNSTGTERNRGRAGLLAFIHFAFQPYFTLLHQHQSALALFAFFGIPIIYGMSRYWFIQGCGKATIEVVGKLLGSYWRLLRSTDFPTGTNRI